MSNARLGSDPAAQGAQHAVQLLKEAQAIVDGWNLPHIGAACRKSSKQSRMRPSNERRSLWLARLQDLEQDQAEDVDDDEADQDKR
jgi:hypothetical protein